MVRVVVVGGGIFGTSTAIELQQRHHDVILIDETAGTPHPLAASTDISKIARGGFYMITNSTTTIPNQPNSYIYLSQNLQTMESSNSIPKCFWNLVNVFWISIENGTERSITTLELQFSPKLHFSPTPLQEILSKHSQKWNFRLQGQTVLHKSVLCSLNGTKMETCLWMVISILLQDGLNLETMSIFANKMLHNLVSNSSTRQWKNSPCQQMAIPSRFQQKKKKEFQKIEIFLFQGIKLNNGFEVFGDEFIIAASAWNSFLVPELKGFLSANAMQVFHFRPDISMLQSYTPENGFHVFLADIDKTGFYGFPATNGFEKKKKKKETRYKIQDLCVMSFILFYFICCCLGCQKVL